MKNLCFHTVIIIGMLSIATSCKKNYDDSTTGTEPSVKENSAPDGFVYSTAKTVNIDVQLLTNDNRPMTNIAVKVFAKNAITANSSEAFQTIVSDANGYLKAAISIPAYMDTLLIDAAYPGLPQNVKAYMQGGKITGILGGKEGIKGNFADNLNGAGYNGISVSPPPTTQGATTYTYMGSYTTDGTPKYLVTPGDVITSKLLENINKSLPESKTVPNLHPEYLKGETNTDIVKTADVWLTFVSEGAGYVNSLGYYTYPTNNPPKNVNDISDIKLVFPNASLSGSGGGMKSGDKVLLGRYEPGTSMGYVIFQNAWDSKNQVVKTNATKYYTDDQLNSEKDPYKRHTVLLYDDAAKVFLVGFEDKQRDVAGSSDEDFNDLLFYITSNPIDAVSKTDVNPIDTPLDTDGDGVSDTNDQFPTDPTKAYVTYFPSEKTWATLAFEDRWPSEGDYDMNDMVVGYRYKYINNAKNETVEMYGDYTLRATGASFINGFGIQLPVTSDKIASVDGQKLIAGYIKTNANKTEASQEKAVIIPFDDTRALIPQGGFANTRLGSSYIKSDTAHLYIKFVSPLAATTLGVGPYNPFLISNQRRGYEIHLPGTLPTNLADKTLFGTAEDKTDLSKAKYYLTETNMPWALSFTETFSYPVEEVHISKTYLHFAEWAKSGGTLFTDWYNNTGAGYREIGNIFK